MRPFGIVSAVCDGRVSLRDDYAHELDVEPPGFDEPLVAPRWSGQEAEHVST